MMLQSQQLEAIAGACRLPDRARTPRSGFPGLPARCCAAQAAPRPDCLPAFQVSTCLLLPWLGLPGRCFGSLSVMTVMHVVQAEQPLVKCSG